jgi:cell division septation protein DedD
LAHHAQDDGFHEIQLNGKQLVFLFMAATVVSVVIFLCGVLVGRGVRAERGIVNDGTVASAPPTEPVPRASTAASPPPAGTDPTQASAPPAASDEALSYPDRLEKPRPQKETLEKTTRGPKPPPAPKLAPPKDNAPQVAEKVRAPQKAPPTAQQATAGADGTPEFTVQIAAYNARGEADAAVRRLTTKGYAAYVVPPGNGAAMYRVRVGKFKTRHDAEPVAARLQREESYKPWITR